MTWLALFLYGLSLVYGVIAALLCGAIAARGWDSLWWAVASIVVAIACAAYATALESSWFEAVCFLETRAMGNHIWWRARKFLSGRPGVSIDTAELAVVYSECLSDFNTSAACKALITRACILNGLKPEDAVYVSERSKSMGAFTCALDREQWSPAAEWLKHTNPSMKAGNGDIPALHRLSPACPEALFGDIVDRTDDDDLNYVAATQPFAYQHPIFRMIADKSYGLLRRLLMAAKDDGSGLRIEELRGHMVYPPQALSALDYISRYDYKAKTLFHYALERRRKYQEQLPGVVHNALVPQPFSEPALAALVSDYAACRPRPPAPSVVSAS